MTWLPSGGSGSVYIVQRDEPQPSDQTDLKGGWRCVIGVGGGTFQKLGSRGAWGDRSTHPGVPSGPTSVWSPLVSSRTFWCLPFVDLRNLSVGLAYSSFPFPCFLV